AAEDFPDEEFRKYHTFSKYENKIIRKLIAHGPVLIRGGRGSGKSALLKEAYFRSNEGDLSENVLGVYVSVRHLPLLRAEGKDYEDIFCKLLIDKIRIAIDKYIDIPVDDFSPASEIGTIQSELTNLSEKIEKRIILFFDDAAHIGRETSLKEFFDIFRTLSSNTISCKATIYPGVTEFGSRFDLLNDATVIDISRNEENPSFTSFFKEILERRYSNSSLQEFLKVSIEDFSGFVGRAVTGNVRAFIYAINHIIEISEEHEVIGLREIEATLKHLATEYYWPLLEELEPKLGKYEPLIRPTRELTETLYKEVSYFVDRPGYGPSCLIHRDVIERLKKLFEIMEYAGFIVKRDSSRAMKSGGRGTRYILNLSSLLEVIPGNRLTTDLFKKWNSIEKEYPQIYKRGVLDNIILPELKGNGSLGILEKPISVLKKSNAYPYGLTSRRIEILESSNFKTVGDLADANDDQILELERIGDHWLGRIKSVVGQAIWM
ncbi:ATP-binding protein, partial [Bacillus velezensis]